MPVMDEVSLLGEIAEYAAAMTARPPNLVGDELIARCDDFRRRLAEAIEQTAYRHIVDRFAPLQLDLIRLGLKACRHGDNATAERCASAAAFFIEYVRADGRALLSAAQK